MKQTGYSCIGLLLLIACQQKPGEQAEKQSEPNKMRTTGFVERVDDALDMVIARDAQIEILAEGFDWTEGPLWLEGEKLLLFSDIPPNTVYSWHEERGSEIYLRPSGYTGDISRGGEVGSNGLLLDKEGNLVLCQHGDRRVAVMNAPVSDPRSDFRTMVDNFQGKKLNSPNDATYSESGELYFTDPPYGLEKNVEDPAKELNFQGVYKLDLQNNLHLLTDQLTRPNGIALSNDEHKLYVANSDPEKAIWMEYIIMEDGKLDAGRVFYDATEWVSSRKGLPDGLKVHPLSGNIFATGPGGVWIFDPDGKHLGTIRTGEATSNCALGDENKYLYMTADMYLMRIPLIK